MTPALIDTIFVVGIFIAIMFCQFMSQHNKTKHAYKNSLFWDINTMLLTVNQEWLILYITWYTTVIKGVLLGINGLIAICAVISAVYTINVRLKEVPVIEPCETADDIIKREG